MLTKNTAINIISALILTTIVFFASCGDESPAPHGRTGPTSQSRTYDASPEAAPQFAQDTGDALAWRTQGTRGVPCTVPSPGSAAGGATTCIA